MSELKPRFDGVRAILAHHAGQFSERVAFRFIDDDGAVATLLFGELHARVRSLSAAVRAHGLEGERALLLFEPGLDFIVAFLGCLDAGVVAVPAYPPAPGRLDKALPRLVAVAQDADARALLTTEAMAQRALGVVPEDSPLRALDVLTVSELVMSGAADEGATRTESGNELVFLQYTSGSTGDPRGVRVGRSELLATLEMWRRAAGSGPETRVVTWAPFYHDLGLVTGVLHPLYVGAESTLMSPLTFLRRPRAWLEACTTYQATMTAAPNFALDLCASRVADVQGLDLSSLEILIVGGEPALGPTLRRFVTTFEPAGLSPDAIYVGYGLAEAVVSVFGGPRHSGWSSRGLDAGTLEKGQAAPASSTSARTREIVSCGRPLAGVRGKIVDEVSGVPAPNGQIGEIWLQGGNVCSGYWNRPRQSEHTFQGRLPGEEGVWLRTGDLGFMDGLELFVTGRSKDLIIVRGRNHYPQDLERAVLRAHPAVRSGGIAAFGWQSDEGEQVGLAVEVRLEGLETPAGDAAAEAVRRALIASTGVAPRVIALLRPGGLPKTSSGKIRRLEAASRVRRWVESGAAGDDTCVAIHLFDGGADSEELPDAEWTKLLAELPTEERAPRLVRWVTALLRSKGVPAGPDDAHVPVWELGLDSQAAAALLPELSEALGVELAGASLVDHPTPDALAKHILGELRLTDGGAPSTEIARTESGGAQPRAESGGAQPGAPGPTPREGDAIAILGMGCRFPGGVHDPESFWRLIETGADAITEVPASRWNAERLFDPAGPARGRSVTRWGGFVDDIDRFDAALFGISAREAEAMDPAHRLLLETSWQALEHAGLDPLGLAGSATAVYIGAVSGEYGQLQMATGHEHAGGWLASGNAASAGGGRLSYFYGFRGPNVSIDTACSSSLVAVHQAVTSLILGEADLALAGGVNVLLNPGLTVALSQAGMMSRRGRCMAFDAAADGYVRSEGCGFVVLKRLADAQRDGDPIRAVILGSAVNQDGRSGHLTAPNVEAQQAVIAAALQRAGVAPSEVGYVEAHGTGTPIGDPVEAAALGAAYGRDRPEPLPIGSIKTQIGHTELAAGVAGLIRTVLALEHGALPPSLHLRIPNPEIPWDHLGVRVQTEVAPWPGPDGAARKAGVSAFGFSGTNVHVVVRGAPPALRSARPSASPGPQTLCLSAHTGAALQRWAEAITATLDAGPDLASLCDAVRRRASLPMRLAIVGAASAAELREPLAAARRAESHPQLIIGRAAVSGPPSVALLFPGQGAQFAGMGQALYEADGAFREALDECDALLAPLVGESITAVMFAADPRLHRTRFTQPALFALQVALVQSLRARGVHAQHLLGHSVGEVTAAWAAGALDLADAALLVARRAAAMDEAREGGMLAVALPADELRDLPVGLEVAAINAPEQTVVSGPEEPLEALRKELDSRGVVVRRLQTSHAFHSAAMDAAAESVVAVAAKLHFRTPATPWIGNVTGERIETAPNPQYWGRQLRQPVRFEEGLRALRASGADVLVEVGPGTALSSLVRQIAPDWEAPLVQALVQARPAVETFERAVASLFCAGVQTRRPGPRAPLLDLPSYPFEATRWWDDSAHPDTRPRAAGGLVCGPSVSGAVVMRSYSAPYEPLIADHALRGRLVFSGAALTALLIEAAAATRPGPVVLQDLTFDRPLLPPADGELRVEAHVSDNGEARVHADTGDGRWQGICHAIRAPLGAVERAAPLPRVEGSPTAASDFYERHSAWGYELGPSYRRLTDVRVEGNSASAGVSASDSDALVDAGALDAAFQLLGALVEDPGGDPGDEDLRVPNRIARVRLHRPAGRPAQVFATLSGGAARADLRIVDDEGRPVLDLEGVELARLPADALDAARRPVIWRVHWSASEIDPAENRPPVRLIGDPARVEPLAASLRAAGRTIVSDEGPSHQIVWLAPPAASIEDLALVVRQAASGRSGLWCVTTDALPREKGSPNPAHRALWGLMRVLQAEAPAAFGGIIDLPATASALAFAPLLDPLISALGARPGLQARIDGAGLATPTLVPLGRGAATGGRSLPFSAEGTCVITGGAGRIGLELAADLVDRGAQHVVLVGRRTEAALSESAHRLLETAEVTYERADVGDPAQVEDLLRRLSTDGPPIRAIFHGAGLLSDGLLVDQSPDDLRAVASPKAVAARALDAATRELALDQFVVFSSAAAVLGSVGQGAYAAANLEMEAVVLERRRMGLPGIAIRFGPWDGGGMVTDSMSARWQAAGVTPLTPQRALDALHEVLRADVALATVIDARWSTVASNLGIAAPSLLPAADPDDSRGRGWLRDRIVATGDPDSRRELVIREVRARLATSLGAEPSSLDLDVPMQVLGVDSLVTLELAYALEHGLDQTVPGATLTSLGDIGSVVAWVLEGAAGPGDIGETQGDGAGPITTSSQRRLLRVERRHPRTAMQHMQVALHVAGTVDPDRLQTALTALVAAHDALRMGFSLDPEAADARIHPTASIVLDRQTSVDEARRVAGLTPFDLARPPLLRATHVPGDPDDVVIITVHHLVADGWSVANLLRDLAAAYEGRALSPSAQVSDVALEEAAWLRDHGPELTEAWRAALAGWTPPKLPRRTGASPTESEVAGETLILRWSPARTAALTEVAKTRGCTLFEALLTCTSLTLTRATGSRDVGLVTVVSGRTRAASAGVVGMLANTVPVRVDHQGGSTLSDVLVRARDSARFADRNGRLPYDEVLRLLDPPTHDPFDVLFVLENLPLPEARLGGLPVTVRTYGPDGSVAGTAKFPLTIACDLVDGALRTAFSFRTGLFSRDQVQGWLDVFDRLATTLIDQAELSVDAIEDAAFVAPTPERIHLAEVLPDEAPRFVTPLRDPVPADGALLAGSEPPGADHRPAHCVGGALEFPADSPRTLGQALARTAQRWGDDRGITYVGPSGQTDHQGFATLYREALQILSGYRSQGLVPGDVVIHQLGDLRRHFTSFQACVLGGLVPVTVALPTSATGAGSVAEKLLQTWLALDGPAIVTDAEVEVQVDQPRLPRELADAQVIDWPSLEGFAAAQPHEARPDDVLFLQLSSGSTGASKAIVITHAGVLAHVEGARLHCRLTDDDVTLNWLAVDHVVPMLTVHLEDVVLGLPEVQVATRYVMAEPVRWLHLLQDHGVTRTWAPNFAFRLVTEALDRSALKPDLDLRHVRQLLNAGEQVTLPVIAAFLKATEPFGIAPGAMQPSFGMAEACTCMTYRLDFDVVTAGRWVVSDSLAGRLEFADGPGRGVTHFVDLGPPVPGVELRITDAAGRLLQEGVIGRFQIKGPVVTPGYRGADDANAEAFVGEGWFDSGDLGFLAEGRLYLTGRAKEMIVVRGVNVFCHEVERIAGETADLQTGGQAAVPVVQADGGAEGFALFITPGPDAWDRRHHLAATVRAALGENLGLSPECVVPLAPGELSKTTSGKLQRAALGRRLAAGEFDTRLRELSLLAGDDDTLPHTFHTRTWVHAPLSTDAAARNEDRAWAVLADDQGLGAALAERIGGKLVDLSHLRAERPAGLVDLRGWGRPVGPSYSADRLERRASTAVQRIIELAEALPDGAEVKLRVVVSGLADTHEGELDPVAAMVAATVRTLAHEQPWIAASVVDLPFAPPEEVIDSAVACLQDDEPETAWVGGRRRVPRFVAASLDAPGVYPFSPGDTWLLTGGLGGVGRRIARAMLDRGVKLVVLARDLGSADKQRVAAELAAPDQSDVQLVECDVTDPAAVRSVIDGVGQLDGVLHLATGYDVGPLAAAAGDELLAGTAAKWLGAWALDRALGDRGVPLIVVGSLNGVFGGFHAGGYSAANRFVEVLAARRRGRGLPARCLAFGLWRGVGISADQDTSAAAARHGFLSFSPSEGTAAALVALAHGTGDVWVGLDRHHEAMASWLLQGPPPRPPQARDPTPPPQTLPIAPATDAERQIAALWSALLDREEIDVTANFFELGGDSLAAVRLAGQIQDRLGVELDFGDVFAHPTVRAMATRVEAGHRSPGGSTEADDGLEGSGPTALSADQERLWFLQRLEPRSPMYNVSLALRLRGPLDSETLKGAFDRTVSRHDALRTRIVESEGVPMAEVVDQRPPDWRFTDLQGDGVEDALRLGSGDAGRPFDLADDPLIRIRLIRLAADDHVLVVVVHHVVVDGWSLGKLVAEVGADLAGETLQRPAWRPTDHVAWRQSRADADGPLIDWWKQELAGLPPAELPPDHPRPERRSHRGASTRRTLSPKLVEGLRALAAEEGATLFMTLVAALGAAIAHESGEEVTAIGTPVATREHPKLEDMVGFLVNTIVVRSDTSGDPTFRELLGRSRTTCLHALAHAAAPFGRLVEALRPVRDAARNPLFDVLLVLQDSTLDADALPGLTVEELPLHTGASRFDLHLAARTEGKGLLLDLEYDSDLYEASTAELLLHQLESLLQAAVDGPDQALSEITARIPRRVRQIALSSTFPTGPLAAPLALVGELVGQPVRCRLAEDGVAVDALLDPASPLSHDPDLAVLVLRRQDMGVEPSGWVDSVVVAVRSFTARTAHPVLVIHTGFEGDPAEASLVSGLRATPSVTLVRGPAPHGTDTLVPDPRWFAAVSLLIHRHFDGVFRPPVKVVAVDADDTLWRGVVAEDGADGLELGAPHLWLQRRLAALSKAGVLVAIVSRNHEDDVRQALAEREDWPLKPDHIVGWSVGWRSKVQGLQALAQELSLGLDSFVFVDDNPVEIAEVRASLPQVRTLPLPVDDEGRSRVLRHAWMLDPPMPERRDSKRTARYLADRGRRASYAAAADFAEFLESLDLVVEMEPLAQANLERAVDLSLRTNQFNTTTRRRGEAELRALAGREDQPVWTVRATDRFGDHGIVGLVVSEPGEAWVVSDFLLSCRVLGRGVEHHVLRWLGDRAAQAGASTVRFEFRRTVRNAPVRILLERAASEVASEEGWFDVSVESLRTAEPFIAAAAGIEGTATHQSGRWADTTAHAALIDPAALAAALQPRRGRRVRASGGEAPTTEAERAICDVWQQLLGVDRISRDDDFFQVGGDSLLAVRMLDPLSEALGRTVRLIDVFATPTPRALAAALQRPEEGAGPVVELSAGAGSPLWLVHPVDGDLSCYLPLVKKLSGRYSVRGLRARGLDAGESPEVSFAGLVRRYVQVVHDAQPEGPLRLGGWSMGGGLALAMAAQLKKRGRDVRWVALIDTRPPEAWRKVNGASVAATLGAAASPEGLTSAAEARARRVTSVHAAGYLLADLPPVDVPITLIHGDDAGPLPSTAGPDDWRAWGSLRAVQAPGHHYNLLDADHVEHVAEALLRL